MTSHAPFRADMVGSLLRPAEIKTAREALAHGKIDAAALKALEDECIARAVKKQEEIGIDIIVDGEMYRGDMTAYFSEHVEGLDLSGFVRSYGTARAPLIPAS